MDYLIEGEKAIKAVLGSFKIIATGKSNSVELRMSTLLTTYKLPQLRAAFVSHTKKASNCLTN